METKFIKQKIREKYSNKINGYFFDNLIHITDNEDEYNNMQRILPKYDRCKVI